jgi:hypothetical protein
MLAERCEVPKAHGVVDILIIIDAWIDAWMLVISSAAHASDERCGIQSEKCCAKSECCDRGSSDCEIPSTSGMEVGVRKDLRRCR